MADYDFTIDTPDLADRYAFLSETRQLEAGKDLVRRLKVSNSETVLDVGAGTGALATYAADRVGPLGRVHGIDPLSERIAIATRTTRPQLSFEVGNAYELEGFGDDSFDVIYLNAVFHWLPEKIEPLKSFHRLLKPGGRLGIFTISRPHPSNIRIAKDKVFADPQFVSVLRPEESGPQPLSVGELETALRSASFSQFSIDLIDGKDHLDDAETYIDFIEASSFGNFLNRLPTDLRAEARKRIGLELDVQRTSEGIPLGGKSLVAVATK